MYRSIFASFILTLTLTIGAAAEEPVDDLDVIIDQTLEAELLLDMDASNLQRRLQQIAETDPQNVLLAWHQWELVFLQGLITEITAVVREDIQEVDDILEVCDTRLNLEQPLDDEQRQVCRERIQALQNAVAIDAPRTRRHLSRFERHYDILSATRDHAMKEVMADLSGFSEADFEDVSGSDALETIERIRSSGPSASMVQPVVIGDQDYRMHATEVIKPTVLMDFHRAVSDLDRAMIHLECFTGYLFVE